MKRIGSTGRISRVSLAMVAMAVAALVAVPLGSVSDQEAGGMELWITQQDGGRLLILHPDSILQGGPVETIALPAGAHPHITTFSPDGKFAYVSDLGMGHLFVIRADDRQIVATLNLGMTMTHQAKPSPDGTLLLVANMHSKTLFKVTADEAAGSWSVVGNLSLAKAPVCTVFRDDGLRAFVSLLPSGIAIVDVPTMTLLGTLATDGFVACGMIKSQDGETVFIASSGGGDTGCNPMTSVGICPGHLYRLDVANETLLDRGTLGAASWHSFNLNEDEEVGFGSSPASDQLQVIDLENSTATPFALDPTPGPNNDRPDAIAVMGDTLYVSLRASGLLAIITVDGLKVTSVNFVSLAPPSPFALHGVALRPSAED